MRTAGQRQRNGDEESGRSGPGASHYRAEVIALALALTVLVASGGLLLSLHHAWLCSRATPELAREIACDELAQSGTERLKLQLRTLLEMFAAGIKRDEP